MEGLIRPLPLFSLLFPGIVDEHVGRVSFPGNNSIVFLLNKLVETWDDFMLIFFSFLLFGHAKEAM
jgi:hypothetical protein